jgi:hypothetical protein
MRRHRIAVAGVKKGYRGRRGQIIPRERGETRAWEAKEMDARRIKPFNLLQGHQVDRRKLK